MRHAAYPGYKESGVDWLGDLPEHWPTARISALARPGHKSFTDGDWVELPYITDSGVRLIQTGNIGIGTYREQGFRYIDDSSFAELRCTEVNPGDVLICRLADPVGRACRAPDLGVRMITSVDVCILKPSEECSPSYLTYLLSSRRYLSYVESLVRGGTRDRISRSMLGAITIPNPPQKEQQAIAAFLDHETAKVGALIAKKQQLIDRLAEYRTALITRTVTEGLPPDVARAEGFDPSPRLKPAGAEWLGDVPEHWNVVENRRVFRERDERSDDGEGELLTVSHITGVTKRSEKPEVGMFMAESLEYYKRCYRGDFVINTMWAWMGAAGTAKEAGLVSPSYNVYVPDHRRLLPKFVDLAYRSSRYVLGMTSESRGIWSSRLRLYPQHFLSLVTAVPPLREQEAIIAHVDAVEVRLERLSEMVCTAIERLQEYRNALITAAVTGKIDVRDYAAVKADGSAA